MVCVCVCVCVYTCVCKCRLGLYRHTFVDLIDLLTRSFHRVIANRGISRYRGIDQNFLVL